MTQEELMKDLEDKEKDTLDTYTKAFTNDKGTGMIDKLDEAYSSVDTQLAAGQTMLENANKDQLDYTIDEIERQKAQTQKDYEKEQKAAYTDYQKQVDPYGVNAEKMASAGLDNSGFAESSKVAMYNQYQQRVAVARDSMQRSIAEYDATIAQARASNSVAMAQLAYDTLMKKMQYTTEHMLKRNDLLITMTEGQTQIKQNATKNWLDTLGRLESGEFDGGVGVPFGTEGTGENENNGFLNNIWQFFNPKENEQDSNDAEDNKDNAGSDNVVSVPEGEKQRDTTNATALGNFMNEVFRRKGEMPEGDPYGLSIVYDYQTAANVLERLNVPESEKKKLMTRAQFKAWKKGLSDEDKAKPENDINYQQYLRDFTEYAVYYYGNKG